MDRLGFLKRLGILATASLIPDWAVSKTSLPADSENVIPYNPNGGIENEIYKNHMSIQRKGYEVTGSRMGVMFYDKYGNPSNVIWSKPQIKEYARNSQ